MKLSILFVLALSFSLSCGTATAGPASDALGVCMTDFLNGKERKELGKWIFFGMSAHPEISEYANVSEELRNSSNQYIGELITRLLTDDCVAEARNAINTESTGALTSAFELVGRVAMQELMADANVSSSLGAFEKYLDVSKLQALQAAQ